MTLNIAVGGKKSDKKKPVLVIFHNGDFSFGGSADPLMYGDNLTSAYSDFIGVSFNYRLGIFGFIDFSEITGGENYPDTLNLGLLDQIAALKWIKENISNFGGDSENITVMGFESGATSISLLATCEQAKGLFQRAFIFFGSSASAHDNSTNSRNFAKQLLKETSTSSMAELMQLSTEQLKDAAQKLWSCIAAPTRDGKFIPSDMFQACRNGAANGIEFIIGIPNNESQVYKSFVGQKNYNEFISKMTSEIEAYLDADTEQAVKNTLKILKSLCLKLTRRQKFWSNGTL